MTTAYCIGFNQVIMVVCVEIVNILVIIQSNTFLDVVMDFFALAIIADFDDMFALSLSSDPLLIKYLKVKAFLSEEIIPHALRIDTTTSEDAKLKTAKNEIAKKPSEEEMIEESVKDIKSIIKTKLAQIEAKKRNN